ncbi:MAG TPA: hypothetical protein VHQ90_05025, partial [Thermoanaerobaculia bacterium]|nr:hypothetical protein [Thermoanaerobaculia bacterium]
MLPSAASSDLECAKFFLSVAVDLGAAIAFGFGLWQYRQAQLWRRNEFIGGEMKAFLTDPVVRNALLMIDWGRQGASRSIGSSALLTEGHAGQLLLEMALLFPVAGARETVRKFEEALPLL